MKNGSQTGHAIMLRPEGKRDVALEFLTWLAG
jgi:hypothetical protein